MGAPFPNIFQDKKGLGVSFKMFVQLLLSGLVIGGIYGLIALGYSLIYKAPGLMSFAQGDLLPLGAFLGLTFYKILGLPFAVSLILTIIISFLLGMSIERIIIRVLLARNVMPIYIVLATIAVSYVVQNGAMLTWGSNTQYFPPIFEKIGSITIFGRQVQVEYAFCIILACISMLILNIFMNYTRIGTAMRASALNPMAASACGINVSTSRGITWGLSAGLAALGGLLMGPIYGVYVMLGATIGRKGFASAVIGGYGNMIGAVVGALILGITETFIAGYVSSTYKDMIAYGLLLLFLFVRPTGIFNERALADE